MQPASPFTDPTLTDLWNRVHAVGLEIAPITPAAPNQYFTHLVESILSQQLSVKASDPIIGRARQHVGGAWTPEAVLAAEETGLRASGLSGSKTKYLKNLAEFWSRQEISPENYAQLDDEALIAHLTQVKGIGRWTVEMFLIFCLGRPDIFSFGDFGLRKGAMLAYGMPEMPLPAALRGLTDSWAPHRSLASRVLWKSLELPKLEASAS